MSKSNDGGPFHRKGPDKRFVKHVTGVQFQPTHWVPMNLQEYEAKLMEIRKYSAEYFDIDNKFRRPNLELISCFTIQNPFLLGAFFLRKEQLAMELRRKTIKERLLYFPLESFREIETAVRRNLREAISKRKHKMEHLTFYANSYDAFQASVNHKVNPRVMIVARVLIGICYLMENEDEEKEEEKAIRLTIDESSGIPVNTWTNGNKTIFIKNYVNEIYPETLLIYRYKDADAGPDIHRPRINRFVKSGFIQISYRAGTRHNPEEAPFTPDSENSEKKSSKKKKPKSEDKTKTPRPKSTSAAAAAAVIVEVVEVVEDVVEVVGDQPQDMQLYQAKEYFEDIRTEESDEEKENNETKVVIEMTPLMHQ